MPSSGGRLVLLAGDGIGPEVAQEARLVLELLAPAVDIDERLIGGAAIRATGSPFPDETRDACLASLAVLKGPVGDPEFDAADVRPEQGLLALRAALDAYANLRPAVAEGVDVLIVRELGLVDDAQPSFYGGQAEGCSPVARAWETGEKLKPVRPNTIARSLAIGSPADGELAVSTARASSGAVYAVAEDEIADNVALLAETTGIFGETAPGVTLGALREAVRRGELGADDSVVLLVTGDGLKTPGLVADRLAPTVVAPDSEEILQLLEVAA